MGVDQLTRTISLVLEQLLERGFKPPIHFAAISVNGAILGGTFEDNGEILECKMTVDHTPTASLAIPINIMFTDSRGEAARVAMNKAAQESFEIQ